MARKTSTAQKKPQEGKVKHAGIHEAIIALMQDVPYLQRRSAKGLNYTFLSEQDLIAKVRPALIKNGLIIVPTGVTLSHCETYPSSSGRLMNRVILTNTYGIVHESKETISVMSAGEGTDIGDKATAKAMTQAYKYAVREAVAIVTGDDPDLTPSEEQEQMPNADGYMKIMAAFTRATQKSQLLQLRIVYWYKRGFNEQQIANLESTLKERWSTCAGDIALPEGPPPQPN